MAATISVPYTILMDSGIVENISLQDGPGATVKFKCKSSDRYQLCKDLLGGATASGRTITNTYPFAYPPSQNLICQEISSIEMLGPAYPLPGCPPEWVTRAWAVVVARFVVARFFPFPGQDPSGRAYTETTLQLSSQGLTLPDSVFTFPSGAPTNTPATLKVPQIQISMKRMLMPFIPILEMSQVVGKVNVEVFTVGDLSCPPGTVLFLGGPCSIMPDPTGNILYTTEYLFSYQAIPWNQLLSPKPSEGFATPTTSGGATLYQSADFSVLP